MADTTTSTRQRDAGSRGPRRSAETTDRILAATRGLLAEGPRAVTMRAVAARAGVTRPAIYRRWESREALVAEVVDRMLEDEFQLTDHGSLRADLTALMRSAMGVMRGDGGEVMRSVVALGVDDELFREALRGLHRRRRVHSLAAMARGVRRGEICMDADLELLTDLAFGPIWTRLLISGVPFDERTAHDVVEMVIAAGRAKRHRAAGVRR